MNSVAYRMKIVPHIYEYNDYNSYLQDYYRARKVGIQTFSYASFARLAGIESRAYVKLVFDGKRPLGMELLPKFCKGLSLNRNESRFLEQLVVLKRAKDPLVRQSVAQRLSALSKGKAAPLLAAQRHYYCQWYFPLIREMLALADMPPANSGIDHWIHKRSAGKITPAQARKALETLEEIGLIHKPDNRYSTTEETVASTDELVDLNIQAFHNVMMDRGKAALAEPTDQREITGVTLAIASEQVPELKARIKEFRDEINREFGRASKAGTVCHLGIQFFSLTDR